MSEDADTLKMLLVRIDALEKRVRVLEGNQASAEAVEPAAQAVPLLPERSIDFIGVFAVLGKAMLGIAGAYLLRAVAASELLPRPLVAAVAILYALAWLVGAARQSRTQRLAGSIYAGTSALILAPMLWETTLDFKAFPAALAAGVLALYAALGVVLTRREEQSMVYKLSFVPAAVAALALAIGSHQMLPFLALLLMMVVVCEAPVGGQGAVRIPVVLLADLAVWIQIFLYRIPAENRGDYPFLSPPALLLPALALFVIHAVSVGFKSGGLRKRLSVFDVLQTMAAFLLASCSLLFLDGEAGRAAVRIAVVLFAAASYGLTYWLFRNHGEPRNFHVCAVWALALTLCGVFWMLPQPWAAALLGLGAVASIVLGVRIASQSFEFHGVLYLAIAAGASGMMNTALQALAGEMPHRLPWIFLLLTVCSLLGYAAGRERVGEAWQQQILHFVPAALTVGSMAALLVRLLVALASYLTTPDLQHVAFLRTLTICLIALALAFGGAFWQRLEMTRIAYLALIFAAIKLIFEDLRLGQMGFIAGSICLFALTLIAVPRLARWGEKLR